MGKIEVEEYGYCSLIYDSCVLVQFTAITSSVGLIRGIYTFINGLIKPTNIAFWGPTMWALGSAVPVNYVDRFYHIPYHMNYPFYIYIYIHMVYPQYEYKPWILTMYIVRLGESSNRFFVQMAVLLLQLLSSDFRMALGNADLD